MKKRILISVLGISFLNLVSGGVLNEVGYNPMKNWLFAAIGEALFPLTVIGTIAFIFWILKQMRKAR